MSQYPQPSSAATWEVEKALIPRRAHNPRGIKEQHKAEGWNWINPDDAMLSSSMNTSPSLIYAPSRPQLNPKLFRSSHGRANGKFQQKLRFKIQNTKSFTCWNTPHRTQPNSRAQQGYKFLFPFAVIYTKGVV